MVVFRSGFPWSRSRLGGSAPFEDSACLLDFIDMNCRYSGFRFFDAEKFVFHRDQVADYAAPAVRSRNGADVDCFSDGSREVAYMAQATFNPWCRDLEGVAARDRVISVESD